MLLIPLQPSNKSISVDEMERPETPQSAFCRARRDALPLVVNRKTPVAGHLRTGWIPTAQVNGDKSP